MAELMVIEGAGGVKYVSKWVHLCKISLDKVPTYMYNIASD